MTQHAPKPQTATQTTTQTQHSEACICAHCGHKDAHTDAPCPSCGSDVLLQGHYVLKRIAGEGGAGITYQARDLRTDRDVAVKELSFRTIDSTKTIELFEREAKVLKSIDVRGVVRGIDSFSEGHGKHLSLYLVQEFIHGHTLASERNTSLYKEREILNILEEITQTLDQLHSYRPPIIHRDIKPSNIMRRTRDNALVLIDFGSVRDSLKDKTIGGSTVAGTFGYMAPESFRGLATPATDIFSLGATVFNLLTNRDPSILPHKIDDKTHITESVSPPMHALLRDMLQTNPEHRISSAKALLRRIRSVRNFAKPKPTPTKTPTTTLNQKPDVSQPSRGKPYYTDKDDYEKNSYIIISILIVSIFAIIAILVVFPGRYESGPAQHELTPNGWNEDLTPQRPRIDPVESEVTRTMELVRKNFRDSAARRRTNTSHNPFDSSNTNNSNINSQTNSNTAHKRD